MGTTDRFLTKQEEGIKAIRFAFQNKLHHCGFGVDWNQEKAERDSKNKFSAQALCHIDTHRSTTLTK